MQITRRAFLASGAAARLAPAEGKPNIIVILADDLGYADLGFQGSKDIPTPHIDRLARSGVRFTSGCVSHPFCSPTRAGLMTGRYQQRFGHENNPVFDRGDEKAGLPPGEITIPQVLKPAGYVSGIVGKWHLGAAPAMHPMQRGFDGMFGFLGGGHDYFKAEGPEARREYLIPIERDGRPVEEKEYLTDAFSREAEAFVRRHRSDPFFLYLAYNAPHTPLQVTRRYLDRVGRIADEKRRSYAAMVCAVDDGVGRLMNALRELNLDGDTLVFFLSDNGGPVEVTHSSNAPLRGQKGQLYEGGIRVPFVMRWTGRLPSGGVYRHPVSSLDILPTAAAAAGAPLPSGRKIDGVNLLPYAAGKNAKPPHERLYWRWGGGPRWAVRQGRYKLVKAGEGAEELYDLETDTGETKDLAAARPELRNRLLKAYSEWNAEMTPPVFPGPKQVRPKKG